MNVSLSSGFVAAAQPLVSQSDLAEYSAGLACRQAGEWDAERWTAFRVRYGVYGQRQDGVQMIRIKVPGGIVPTSWLKVLGKVNREYCNADAHITTRQDFQIYGVPLGRTVDILTELYAAGIPTREAGGGTLRNMTACGLSGACPKEHVDAGQVARQLAASWIRHPLVQHLPRKMKFSVSGCATDCAFAPIHDIGFIATERDGVPGFRVLAGGGLGANPRPGIQIAELVAEQDLPTVIEAIVRLHHRYSDRVNRNAARVKFLVKRFGEAKFVELFQEEFGKLQGVPSRPWDQLAWRQPDNVDLGRNPLGVLPAHDGSRAVATYVPLGLISSDQMDTLYDLAVAAGVAQLRTTQTQNLVFLGVAQDKVAALVAGLKAIGFDVPGPGESTPSVVSCPGTSTCRIGITHSCGLARQLEEQGRDDPAAAKYSVHVSGCPNSCSLHHVADIGLHGAGKKIDGKAAPHYQLHFGGDGPTATFGVSGPLVPARQADEAVRLLRAALVTGQQKGESVRAWAERLGKPGLSAILAPLAAQAVDDLYVDWGEAHDFVLPAAGVKGECAASFASSELLADLADDALIATDRFLAVGRTDGARDWAVRTAVFAARMLLASRGVSTEDDIADRDAFGQLQSNAGDLPDVTAALGRFQGAVTGDVPALRELAAVLLDHVRAAMEAALRPVEAQAVDLASLFGAPE